MLKAGLPDGSTNTTDSFETLFDAIRFAPAKPFRQSKSECRLRIYSKHESVQEGFWAEAKRTESEPALSLSFDSASTTPKSKDRP
jgi:hypothetical protein